MEGEKRGPITDQEVEEMAFFKKGEEMTAQAEAAPERAAEGAEKMRGEIARKKAEQFNKDIGIAA